MPTGKLSLIASCLTLIGLLLASCAPALAPTSATKEALPPTKAPVGAPTKPAAPPPTTAPAAPTVAAKPGAEQPRYGGTLNISTYDSVAHYDIYQTSSTVGVLPVQHCYNNLIQHSSQQPTEIIGDLAESWDVSRNGMVYTFRLHKGVKWHDGKPFTAADAKASLDRTYNPPRGIVLPKVGELVRAIKSVETPDPETVNVTLEYVSASFITGLATVWLPVFPKHVLEEKGDMKRTIMGTGPFTFKRSIPDNSFEVVRNKEYFKKGRPYVDTIRYYIIKDPATRFAAFRTRQVQMTTPSYGFTPTQLKQVKQELPEVNTAQSVGGNSVSFYFLLTRSPWNDLRVRRAISLAFDRQEAVRVVEDGLGAVAGPIAPGYWALPQEEVLKLPGYRQPKDEDRAEAKRLLAEAGYAGLKFTLSYRVGTSYQSAAEFFKDQMAKVGVDVSIKPTEYATIYDQLLRHDFDAAQMRFAWTFYDPDDILLPYYRSNAVRNFVSFSDPEVDKLIDEQAKTLDRAKRKEIVLEMQRLIIDRVPFVVGNWGNYVMGWWKDVRNLVRDTSQSTQAYWRLEDIWLAQ